MQESTSTDTPGNDQAGTRRHTPPDIIERLRSVRWRGVNDLCLEAAAEIERLQARVVELEVVGPIKPADESGTKLSPVTSY